MKIKFAVFTLSLLMVLTMATDAFAQGVFRVTSGTESRGRATGHAEAAGNISLFLTNGAIGTDESGVVMIDYGVPITNAVGAAVLVDSIPVDNNINITVCDGNRLAETDPDAVAANRASVSKDGSVLSINLETCSGVAAVIDVRGVLLSLVGSGQDSITASVTNTGDVRLLNNETQVIRAVVNPLSDDEVSVSPITVIRHDGSIDENKTRRLFSSGDNGGPSGLL